VNELKGKARTANRIQLAMNEIYKFVPTVLKKYGFVILKEPNVTRGWFQQPQRFMVKVYRTSDIKVPRKE
jgi:hypothetical protein